MPAIRGSKSKSKTRRHTRDLDQIFADQENPRQLQQFKATKDVEELPGLGEFYCVPCAKWFESDTNYQKHFKGKPHKRRLRQLKDEPHSQKDADAAVGLWTDNGKRLPTEMDEDTEEPASMLEEATPMVQG